MLYIILATMLCYTCAYTPILTHLFLYISHRFEELKALPSSSDDHTTSGGSGAESLTHLRERVTQLKRAKQAITNG